MFHCHMPHHMMNQMMSMVGPVAHVGRGMHAGGGMTAGMGIVSGQALAESGGPSFGRALGVGAERERPAPNMPLSGTQQPTFMQPSQGTPTPPMFPGYPQDMFMVMDDLVAKPETYGLRPTWTGAMMGMMTLVRVMKPELYDKIQELKAQQPKKEKP